MDLLCFDILIIYYYICLTFWNHPSIIKLHTSAELKSIRIVVPTVLGELRCGHITSVSSGKEWVGVSCFRKVSGNCAVCYDG